MFKGWVSNSTHLLIHCMENFSERLAALQKKYSEAVYNESAIREAAFLPITLDICGITVGQFTPYHYLLLDFQRNPFITGGADAPTAGHIAQFLWCVSVEFREVM
jgi:hypothetical protein